MTTMATIITVLMIPVVITAIRDRAERWYIEGRLDQMDKKPIRKWWEFFL